MSAAISLKFYGGPRAPRWPMFGRDLAGRFSGRGDPNGPAVPHPRSLEEEVEQPVAVVAGPPRLLGYAAGESADDAAEVTAEGWTLVPDEPEAPPLGGVAPPPDVVPPGSPLAAARAASGVWSSWRESAPRTEAEELAQLAAALDASLRLGDERPGAARASAPTASAGPGVDSRGGTSEPSSRSEGLAVTVQVSVGRPQILGGACARGPPPSGRVPSGEPGPAPGFYTPTGRCWHLRRDCPSLRRSRHVLSAPVWTLRDLRRCLVCLAPPEV